MLQLTELAHSLIKSVLRPGDIAIDATVGNGHDTQFLAECVGPTGTVYGFDIQSSALEFTAKRIAAAGHRNVILLPLSHAEIRSALPDVPVGRVTVVMFNLGYLPGGDKRLTTQTDSTIRAMSESLALLATGGIVTVIAYTGHHGGIEEAKTIEQFLKDLPVKDFEVSEPSPAAGRHNAPRLFVVRKR